MRALLRPTWSVFLGALALYIATLAPSVNWGDGARIQLDILLGGSNYWFLPELVDAPMDAGPFARLGVAPWDHQLYVLIGQAALAIPLGDPFWRLNVLSSLAAAGTVMLVFRVTVGLGTSNLAAAFGALALTVSHTFWFHAVTTEVLALHVLFMIALVALAQRWLTDHRSRDLRLLAFLGGAGLANHVMLSLTLVPLIVFLVISTHRAGVRVPRRAIAGAALLFFIGFAPWWLQFLRAVRVAGLPLTLEAVTWFPAGPRPMAEPTMVDAAPHTLIYGLWLLYQFTPLGVLLGMLGFWRLARRRSDIGALLTILFVIHLGFSLGIPISDRFAFHLPTYMIVAVWIGIGAHVILEWVDARIARWRLAVAAALTLTIGAAPPLLYAKAPDGFRARWGASDLGIPDIGRARDGLRYFLTPSKRGDDSALRFARAALRELAPDAIVLAPEPSLEQGLVLRSVQTAEASRPDVDVDPVVMAPRAMLDSAFMRRIRDLSPCRPLYISVLPANPLQRRALTQDFTIVAEASLYRVRSRHPRPAVECGPAHQRMTLAEAVRASLR